MSAGGEIKARKQFVFRYDGGDKGGVCSVKTYN